MKIADLKQLDRLLALCQKRGVTSITIDGISLYIERATKSPKPRRINTEVFPEETIQVPQYNGGVDENTKIETIDEETLTEEQLLYYSSRPEAPTGDQ